MKNQDTGLIDHFSSLQVLAAATHLIMAEAVQLSCQFMELAITTDNCVDILNLAELYVLTDSRVKARTYILEHFETFAESAQYFKLNHSQLASLLDQNSLKVGCNDVVATGQYLSGIFFSNSDLLCYLGNSWVDSYFHACNQFYA